MFHQISHKKGSLLTEIQESRKAGGVGGLLSLSSFFNADVEQVVKVCDQDKTTNALSYKSHTVPAHLLLTHQF
jgi:hypothetical protein